jgi:hypothetical protein
MVQDPMFSETKTKKTYRLSVPLSSESELPLRGKDTEKERRLDDLKRTLFLAHVAGRDFSKRQNHLSIVRVDQGLGSLEKLLGSMRGENHEIKTVGNFVETVLYGNARHAIAPFSE